MVVRAVHYGEENQQTKANKRSCSDSQSGEGVDP